MGYMREIHMHATDHDLQLPFLPLPVDMHHRLDGTKRHAEILGVTKAMYRVDGPFGICYCDRYTGAVCRLEFGLLEAHHRNWWLPGVSYLETWRANVIAKESTKK